MKPTIGRIVHYRAPEDCGGAVYPGLVVAVHEGDGPGFPKLDLVTFGPSSIYHNNGTPAGIENQPGCWFWPPRV